MTVDSVNVVVSGDLYGYMQINSLERNVQITLLERKEGQSPVTLNEIMVNIKQ